MKGVNQRINQLMDYLGYTDSNKIFKEVLYLCRINNITPPYDRMFWFMNGKYENNDLIEFVTLSNKYI